MRQVWHARLLRPVIAGTLHARTFVLTSTQPVQRNFTQRSEADNVPPDRGNPVESVIDQFLFSAYHCTWRVVDVAAWMVRKSFNGRV
jgi:hypothetical protein